MSSVCILAAEYIVCLGVPDILDVITLMASTVTMVIGFTIPAAMTIKLAKGDVVVSLASSVMFWIGFAVGLVGLVVSCYNLSAGAQR